MVGDLLPRFRQAKKTRIALGLLLLIGLPLANVFITLWKGKFNSFGLFWTVIGVTVFYVTERSDKENIKPLLYALLAGFCVAVSVGAITPAVAGGLLFAVFVAYGFMPLFSMRRVVGHVFLLLLAVVASVSLWNGRQAFVYMEQPAKNLTERLDGVFPGANKLRTNENTYKFLTDLQKTIELVEESGLPYAILPDVPGYWAASEQLNPLPIDWAKNTELHNPKVMDRVIAAIEENRGKTAFIVQKFEAFPLRFGLRPLTHPEKFAVAVYVRRNFKKTIATECFEVYQ